MRITLVHNPSAGTGLDADQLSDLLKEAGHKVRACSTDDDWRKSLQKKTDLAVVAGGDGTVKEVALALAGADLPLAILPMGTANNVAKTLGITGDARSAISGWDLGAARPFDLATVTAPWGEESFVESFGGGIFAELIESGEELDESAELLGRPTDRALSLLRRLLDDVARGAWGVMVDGQDRDGDYLAVEVLNIRFAGPNVPLAPQADPCDGQLEVALVRPEDRDALSDYVDDRVNLASGTIPEVPVMRGRVIRLRAPSGTRLHLDDRLWPSDEPLRDGADMTVRVRPGALRVVT